MLAHLNHVLEARTVDQVWALHVERMTGYGFDRLFYAYTRINAGGRLGDAANALMLSNHSKAYLDGFIGNELYRAAPMVRWTNENEGVCSWRAIEEMLARGVLTDAERQVIAFNRKHGLTAGYSISFRDLAVRVRGGIGLVARAGLTHDDVDAIWAAHGHEILTLNRVAHLKIISLPHPQAFTALTARQREALEWVAEGKTTQDIAILMGVSAATVEKHLRLARAALAVESTAQAIAKASMMNQIFVLE